MLKVALTGGIATGKSYVLERFRAHGAPTIDADLLVHQALAPGAAAAQAVRSRFGPDVLDHGGAIDRRKLGAIVFADPAARRDLEAILHPAVYDEIVRWFRDLETRAAATLAVADIPLLFETGREAAFDKVIVIACDPALQVRRIVARDGISEKEARQRLSAQLPIAEKIGRADFVIRTDGVKEETDRQVRDVYEALLRH